MGKSRTGFKKLISVLLLLALIFGDGSFSGLRAKDIFAADSEEIGLSNIRIYSEGVELAVEDQYTGNNYNEVVLSNTSQNASDELYMDDGSTVKFNIETTSDDYKIFLSSDSSGQTILPSYDNRSNTATIYGDNNDIIYYKEKNGEVDENIYIEKVDNEITINADRATNLRSEYYLTFVDVEGKFHWVLTIHLLKKTEYIVDTDKSVPVIQSSAENVRQGKTATFSMKMQVIKTGEVKDIPGVTDGYKWVALDNNDLTIESNLGEMSPVGSGNTKFLQQSVAIFHANTENGVGGVRIRAITNSGIIDEENTTACIALTARGKIIEYPSVIPVYEWIPATNISFNREEYNFLINSEINLTSLITATSAQVNVNPNDDYTFSLPNSQSSIAKIDTDNNGNKILKLLKAGTVVLTCAGENASVNASCIIHIYNPTTDLQVSSNDEIIASYSGSIAKNVSVRSSNELVFTVTESEGANEALVWDGNANNYFEYELISDKDNVKVYKFIANEVIQRTEVDLTVRTDRSSTGEGTTGNVKATYKVVIYPAIPDGTELNSYVSYDGEDTYETEEFDLYDNEKATVYVSPEGVNESDPIDQITWTVPVNNSFISKIDYTDISGNNVINATTVSYEETGEGNAVLRGTSVSNENLSKDIKINTKKTIKTVKATVGDIKTATVSLGDTAQIDTVITPEDADELLMYESEYPNYVEVDDTGLITAKQKTDANGVKIYIYSYHERFGKVIRSESPKAIITIKVKVAGSIVIEPENKTTSYTGSEYKLTATAREEGEGSATVIDASRAEWSINNILVASLSADQGASIFASPLMVGNATIKAKFGEAEGESYLAVTAPVSDGHISVSEINTGVSDTPDSDSYIYLPNGGMHNINPVLTAHGIDSRQDDNEDYILVKNEDYLETNSFVEGKGVGKYKFTFDGTGLYTGSKSVDYRIYPKTIGDGETEDDEITVEETNELIYNGSVQTPNLVLTYTKDGASQVLSKGTDYTLSIGQTNVGIYEITVTGRGNFTGSFIYTYEIHTFDLNKNFGSNTLFKSGSEYVQEGNIADQVFNGGKVEPTSLIVVSVILKEGASWKNITRDSDYTIDYTNNDKVGKATAYITGQGNYSGVIYCDYNIIKKDLSTSAVGKTVIADIPNQVYTGFEITPELFVTCNNVELTKDVDYTISYDNNIDSKVKSGANSVATITGIGNYEGQVSKAFVIEQADLSDSELVTFADIPDQYDCSTLLTPDIEVSMGDYKLIEDTDYTVSYGDKTKSTAYNFTQGTTGVVTIVPVANGNFKASEKTSIKEVFGQETFFNILLKTVNEMASDITIVRENGEELINGDIYVNVERSNSVNGIQRFLIETVDSEGGESDDIVAANVDSAHTTEYAKLFSYNVIQIDSTKGNKAILEITGKGAGDGEIVLYSQEGFKKTINVHVNDPATSVSIIVKDTAGKTINATNEQYVVYENHEYILSENLQVGKTDSVKWSVDDESIATIDENGTLITKKPGTVYVTCTTDPSELSDGGVTSTIRFTVKGLGEVSLWLDPEDKTTTYTAASYSVTASAEENTDGTVTPVDTALTQWSISNDKVATLSATEGTSIIVKPLLVGNAVIDAQFSGVDAASTIKVTAPINDNKITISDINKNISNTPDEDAYIYLPNGKRQSITPKLTADGIDSRQGEDEKYVLVKDADYTQEDSFNEGDGIGTYRYTFAGIDLYTSSRYVDYRIFPKTLGDGSEIDGEISVKESEELIYNGLAQTPKLVVTYEKDGESQVLEAGKDYTLSSGKTDVGTYEITVTGKGNFTGSFVYTYEIHTFDLKKNFGSNTLFKSGNDYVVSGNIADQIFNGTVVEVPSLIIVSVILRDGAAWKNINQGTDYVIEYSNNDAVGTATATITGQGNYSGVITCDYNIIKKDLSTSAVGKTVIANIPNQVYTGFDIEPELSVTCNNVELVKDRDYEVSYSNNLNSKVKSGANSVATITGIGNYEGQVSKEFVIEQADLSDSELVTFADIPDQYDCSTLLTPDIEVSMGDYKLIEDTDYTVSYGDKTKSTAYNFTQGTTGVVTIVPVANGNFKASEKTSIKEVFGQEAFFNIVLKSIDETASDIVITRESGDDLINGNIYVNVDRTNSVNGVQRFIIETVDSEGEESEDIVSANVDSAYTTEYSKLFSYNVVQLDSTKGNKAILEITGKSAGSGKIVLYSQGGFKKTINVIVNDPATSVSITVKDTLGKTINATNEQYVVYENHEYVLSENLQVGKTDSVTWSVDKEDIATIDENGTLITIKPGTVYVTCTTNPSELSNGGVSSTIRFTVKGMGEVSLSTSPEDKTLSYNASEYKITATAQEDTEGTITSVDTALANWSIDNPLVASLSDETGSSINVKPLLVGNAIIATEFSSANAESTLKVTAPISDSNVSISNINTNTSDTMDENSYIYLPNGKSQGITPVLTAHGIDSRQDENEDYILVKDTDYTEEDSFVEGGKVGKYKFTFAGSDLYTGSKTVEYRIYQKTIGDGTANDDEITVEQTKELIYNGSAQKPELLITYEKDGESEELVLDKDYTLSSGQTNVGTYEITVTGKGNFKGSFVYTYEIHEFDLNKNFGDSVLYKSGNDYVASGNVADQIFNGSKVEPASQIIVAVMLDKSSGNFKNITNNSDYEIEYIENDKVGTATAIITGKGNYTGVITCDFNIVKKDLSTNTVGKTVIANIDDIVYTGFEITPELSVTCNDVMLVKDRDYTVSYSNNIDTKVKSGSASVATITGIGNYDGEYSKTFNIVQADMSDGELVTFADIPTQYACSTLLTPPVTVTMGDYTLVEGVDYEVLYGDKTGSSEYNFNAKTKGVVTIVPVSNGNFKATAKTTVREVNGAETFFDIVTKEINEPAYDILITREGGGNLIKGAIYVNVNRSGAANGVQSFEIEAIDSEGGESEDIVTALNMSDTIVSTSVTQVDSTKGNKAILTVTGLKAGSGRILLMTQGGTSKFIDVYVNDPATSVSINVKDSQGKAVSEISGSGVYLAYENHDYYLDAVLSVGKTDSVTWSVNREDIATIDENGKLTTLTPGTVQVTCTTDPSELSPGGVSKSITISISKNVLAENITINGEVSSENRIKQNNTLELKGASYSSNGNVTEELEWTIDDPSVLQITKGEGTSTITVKAIGAGTTTVTYGSKLEAGVKASITIEVYVEVTEVKLSYNEQTLKAGKEIDLTATFNQDAIDEFVWTSSDESILSIEGATGVAANSETVVLKGHKAGTVTITVSSKNYNKKATCKVTVIDVNADNIYINGEPEPAIKVKRGVQTPITGTAISGDGTVTEELVWASSNDSIVKIVSSEGGEAVIEGLRNGTATISYYSKSNPDLKAILTVKVYLEVTQVNVSAANEKIGIGTETEINATLNTGAEDILTWDISDSSIAELIIPDETDEGPYTVQVKGKKTGTVTITATSVDTGIEGSCTVVVTENMASNVFINGNTWNEITLKKGETLVLNGSANAQTGEITEDLDWATTNEDIVSIVSGEGTSQAIIKAVGVGEATVTYGSLVTGGKKARLVINVYVEATNIKLDNNEIEMNIGDTKELTGTFNEGATDEWVWTSSDTSIAQLDYENVLSNSSTVTIKAKAEGTVTITAKAKNYDVTKTCTVTVKPVLADRVLIDDKEENSIRMISGASKIITGAAFAADGMANVSEDLVFTSSDEDVVSIAKDLGSGRVQIKAGVVGTAVITYGSTKEGGAIATLNVEVYREVTGLTVDTKEVNVEVGKTADITATFSEGAKDDFVWTFAENGIASITGNEEGLLHEQTVTIKGLAEGTVMLTVSAKNYNYSQVIVVNVKKASSSESGSSSSQGGSGDNTSGQGGNGSSGQSSSGTDSTVVEGPKSGTKIADKKYNYKVTKAGTSKVAGEVAVTGLKKKSLTTIKIAAKVTLGGITYKVTSVDKNAFKNNKKIKKAIIGKNVVTIGNNAFSGCKKLSQVSCNSTALKTIGKNAFKGDSKLKKFIIKSSKLKKVAKNSFKGVKKSCVIKVPKAKKKAYQKLFKKAKCKAKVK